MNLRTTAQKQEQPKEVRDINSIIKRVDSIKKERSRLHFDMVKLRKQIPINIGDIFEVPLCNKLVKVIIVDINTDENELEAIRLCKNYIVEHQTIRITRFRQMVQSYVRNDIYLLDVFKELAVVDEEKNRDDTIDDEPHDFDAGNLPF